jgi:hypothetical protein
MFHTVFIGDKVEAEQTYEGMKKELQTFIDSDYNDGWDWCGRFVEKWQHT